MYRERRQSEIVQLNSKAKKENEPSAIPLNEINTSVKNEKMLKRELSPIISKYLSSSNKSIDSGNASLNNSIENDSSVINNDKKDIQYKLCKINDLNNGEMREIKVQMTSGSQPINILLIKDKNKFYVLGNECAYCHSKLIKGIYSNNRVYCHQHGSSYNIKTGKLEDPPGFDSIPSFNVKLSESDVFISTNIQKLSQKVIINPMTKCRDIINPPIIIIGGGISGITCAEALRQEGFNGRILVISKTDQVPYNRSLLTKKPDNIDEETGYSIRDMNFYKDYDIEIMLGVKVKQIIPDDKCIVLTDDKYLSYSNLVLAMGSVSKSPTIQNPSELEGLIQFHDLQDLEKLKKETDKKHVTIVGSGFLAFELASIIQKSTRSITILGKSEYPLKQFGPYFGRDLRQYVDKQGKVSVRQGSMIRSIEGFDRINHLVLKDGMCAVANTVIVCNGVQPCTSLLAGSKIQTTASGYVTVDNSMRTNQPNIYAIGDITEFPLSVFNGSKIFLQHVQNAQYQARIVAKTIVERPVINDDFVPFLWMDFFDRHVNYCGDPTVVPDDKIIRGSLEENDYRCYTFKNNIVVSVIDCSDKNIAVQFKILFRSKIHVTYEDVVQNESEYFMVHHKISHENDG